MTSNAEAATIDDRGPLLFGAVAFLVLIPYAYVLVATLLATGSAPPPILIARLVLWALMLYLLYLGHGLVRWLLVLVLVLGALSWGAAAVTAIGNSRLLVAAQFSVMAAAQVVAVILLFGSRTLRAFLKERQRQRAAPKAV